MRLRLGLRWGMGIRRVWILARWILRVSGVLRRGISGIRRSGGGGIGRWCGIRGGIRVRVWIWVGVVVGRGGAVLGSLIHRAKF